MTNTSNQTIFSGVQPSGNLHIGNYIGAISRWAELQNEHNCIFCVVDYHAITVKQDPKELGQQSINIVKHYLASGIDPDKSIIFQQSDVNAHTELAWILNCIARISDLGKMTQFKEKAGKQKENVSVGLYDYPVLMAADILLYDTDAVPVGEDQVQHVELTRILANRFNQHFGKTFKIPSVILRKDGARIMGLDNPLKKMSKSSSSPASFVALDDSPEIAAKKIMRAVTDSGNEIKYNKEKKPAISNLLTIYSMLSGISIKDLEKKFSKQGYGNFKKTLSEVVSYFLTQYQKKYSSYSDEEIRAILKSGAEKAEARANKVLAKVKNQIGINKN